MPPPLLPVALLHPLAIVPPPSLAVEPPPVVDRATGLPLILCPEGKDMRLRALMNSRRNLGRRFFKCPRNHEYVSDPLKFISFIAILFNGCELSTD